MLRLIILFTTFALAATSTLSQGAFKPRDADEEQAWRIHTSYKEGRKKEDELTRQIALLRRDIANSSVSTIGVFGSDAKDRERLTKMREQLTAEQAKLRKLETDWDQKFYGRYGHLQDSDATIVDPVTKRTMDKVEFRLINFPFNDVKKKEPLPTTSGIWRKIREKFWPFTSTPNEPDENQEESGAPYDITYVNNYYDRNGTRRWQKDTSHAMCRLDLIDADRVAAGQKVKVHCSLNYKAEHYTSGAMASFWAGEPAIEFPNGFKQDGSLYPMWGYFTEPVLRVSAGNNATGEASGEFSFPAGPRSDKSPFCVKLTSGTHGTAAAEVCYEWQAGSTARELKQSTKWEGQWQSTWGNISITQAGNSITGTYEHDNGRIVGTIVGNKIVGTWSEGPTFTAPDDAGDLEFTLSADGSGFTGRWRYGSNGAWQTKEWTGTRAGIR
ncbi:MAG: hypothetical protein ABL999_14645 [Pyrinomonadaceae bacterium]